MRPYPRIACLLSLAGLAACATAPNPAPVSGQAKVADLAPQLSALDGADQNSPETLNGRLAYAEQLLEATNGDCRRRADAAQAQLDIVVAKPAFSVIMPLGTARAANIAYDIHAARAACDSEASSQQSELRAARDAALRAVDLYRDGFDYQSMAVMQFDAAVADRRLGDRPGAVAMLRSAIAMDGEYGFQKDAEDNQALLQQWADDPADPNREAGPPKTAPSRSAALKFAWSAKDADVTVAASYVAVIKGKIIHSQGSAARTLSIRRDDADWVMSFPSNLRSYGFDQWPQGHADEELSTLLLANIRLSSPAIRVSNAGDFKSLVDPNAVSTKLAAETPQLARSVVPQGSDIATAFPRLDQAVKYFSAPDELEAMASEDYDFTTAEWIGATLDQGVWYDMTAPMRAAGTAYVVDHDIQFAYTRAVPCTPSSTSASCIEIVVHATPNPVALGQWINFMQPQLGLGSGQALHYWSATDIRIVADPNSLLPHASDVRRYWYLSANGGEKSDPAMSSERTVSTANYH